ncbi:MAG: DUF4422 domain-containing protein [Clostridiales bacterium]|jgi:hypothetical protein|nr:DUF4422 domain-containing protein [Clostridiales bacterium]
MYIQNDNNILREHNQDIVQDDIDDGTIIKRINLHQQRQDTYPIVKILVSCHKPEVVAHNNIIVPIGVGADSHSKHSFELSDNEGEDNISHLNARFCELTAQYWAYKNLTADYYGFFHYRRYLSLRHLTTKCIIKVPGVYGGFADDFGLSEDNIKHVLTEVDMVLPYPLPCKSVYRHYKVAHNIVDLDWCIRYIVQKYPDYKEAVHQYMDSNRAYYCNMFVTKQELFVEYSNWLFDILMAFDNQKDYSEYTTQQMRAVGYLGERLLGIFVTRLMLARRDIKIVHAPILYIKDTNNNTRYAVKSKYKQSIGAYIANVMLPRGSIVREGLKKVYTTFLSKS